MEISKTEYHEDCLQGFAYAEKVLRRCCEKEIETNKSRFKKSLFVILKCICEHDETKCREKGWIYTVMEHVCPQKPACNHFLRLCCSKLPLSSKLNRDMLLRVLYKCSSWEFAKLFLEPWMQKLPGLDQLDSFCLLVLLSNVSSLRQDFTLMKEETALQQALYQKRSCKMESLSSLAESCLQGDIEEITKEDRDYCLQAIIDVLAFLSFEDEVDVDEAIGFIANIPNKDIDMKHNALEKNHRLNKGKQDFLKQVTSFASDIPHAKGQNEMDQHSHDEYTLIQEILQNKNLDQLFDQKQREPLPQDTRIRKAIFKTEYEYIQALVHILEKNVKFDSNTLVSSLLDALKLTDSSSNLMSNSHYKMLQEELTKEKCTTFFKEVLSKEAEATNFKVCHLALLIAENALRSFCDKQIKMIHDDIKTSFPRDNLCTSANKNDICRANSIASEGLEFKHECTEDPKCNEFLRVVLSKRSDNCNLTPYTMFRNTNPQDCLAKSWEFAKLFINPCKQEWVGFEDLDAFCLLTLIVNVQMFDANQSEPDLLLEKLQKVRETAFKIMHGPDTEMTKEENTECIQDILYILEDGILHLHPEAGKAITQIKSLTNERKMGPFEIRSFKKQWIICDTTFSNWCKCALALKYLQPAMVDIVEEKMSTFFCQLTEEDKNKYTSLFDYTKQYLDYKQKKEIKEFSKCDVSALCRIITKWVEKEKLPQFDETHYKKVADVRNKTMHSPNMSLNKQEMEERIHTILDFLYSIDNTCTSDEIAIAIENIKQLRQGGFRLPRDEVIELLKEVLATVINDEDYTTKEVSQMVSGFNSFLAEGKILGTTSNENINIRGFHPHDIEREWALDQVPVNENTEEKKQKIYVKSPEDETNCYITDMVAISDTQLILTDRDNMCLKFVDLVEGTVKRQRLPSKPRRITLFPESKVAVLLTDSLSIRIYSADHNLKFVREWKVENHCIGLHCSGDKLFLSYTVPNTNYGKLQILNANCNVLASIVNNSFGRHMFKHPGFLMFCPKKQFIYVSDNNTDTVTCIHIKGKICIVQWTYTSKLDRPLGIATRDDECVYICSSATHTIHVVSSGGNRLGLIQTSQFGLKFPKAICHTSEGQHLYVSCVSKSEDANYISRLSADVPI